MRRKGGITDVFLECNLAVNKICEYILTHKEEAGDGGEETGREGLRKNKEK